MIYLRSPVDAPYNVVQSGWGDDRSYRGGLHEGVDFRTPIGTPIRSVADGVVRAAFTAPDGNAGNMVEVQHAGGLASRYLHLDSWGVNVGQRVSQGQQIAKSGETGSAKGDPQLHFDLRANASFLNEYKNAFGVPGPSGFPQHDQEWAVPTEALVDAVYTPEVKARSGALGVKFYSGVGVGVLLVAAGLGYLGWRWLKA